MSRPGLMFTCPKCGDHYMDEVSTGITAYNKFSMILPDDNDYPDVYEWLEMDYDHDDSYITSYVCTHCGYYFANFAQARPFFKEVE